MKLNNWVEKDAKTAPLTQNVSVKGWEFLEGDLKRGF